MLDLHIIFNYTNTINKNNDYENNKREHINHTFSNIA